MTIDAETPDLYSGVAEWPDESRIRIIVQSVDFKRAHTLGDCVLVHQNVICGVVGDVIKKEGSRIIAPDSVKQGALTLVKG